MQIIKDNCDLINIVALGENIGFPFNEKVYFEKVKPRLEKAMREAQEAVDEEFGQRTRVKVENLKRVKGKGKDREIVHVQREKVITKPYQLAYHDDIRDLTGLDKSVLGAVLRGRTFTADLGLAGGLDFFEVFSAFLTDFFAASLASLRAARRAARAAAATIGAGIIISYP